MFRILPHTADLRLELSGKTLEELFISGAEALADILYKRFKIANASESTKIELNEKIKIKTANLSVLLVDFLNDILTKSYINKAIYKIKSLKLKNGIIEAKLVGREVGEFNEDIKAVTYHKADIKKEKGIFRTKLILDI